MSRTYREYMDAAARADAAGNSEDAQRLVTLARNAQSQESSQPEPAEEQSFQTVRDFGSGIKQGLTTGSEFGQEIIYRGIERFGNEDIGEDLLSDLNRKRARDAATNSVIQERSPWAFGAGALAGEIAFTAPLGGLGAVGGKAAAKGGLSLFGKQMGAKTAGTAALTGEGAAIGAYSSGGEDVGYSATMGALTDLAGGNIINHGSRVIGTVGRDLFNTNKARDIATDSLEVAAKRVDDAAEYGGYTLDGANAHAARRSLDEYNVLKNDERVGGRILDFEAQREVAVTKRGVNIAQQYGSTKDPAAFQIAGQKVQDALNDVRMGDEQKYRSAYRAYDEFAAKTNTTLDTAYLSQGLKAFRDADTSVSRKGFRGQIDEQLSTYGIDMGNGIEAKKALSLENLEDLMGDLNDFWEPTMAPAKQRYLGQVKGQIEKYIDTALSHVDDIGGSVGIGQEIRGMGQAARAARKAYSDSWDEKQILGMITKRTKGGEFAMDYTKVIPKLSNSNLKAVKARLLTADNGTDAWRSMQQAPLLEALAAATKHSSEAVMEGGGIKFNHKAYEGVLSKLDEATKRTLWGANKTNEIGKTIASWKQRIAKPDTSGSMNPSGTALALGKQARFLASGNSRNIGMALVGMLPALGDMAKRGAREEAVTALTKGQTIPEDVYNEIVQDVLLKFEEDFVGAGKQKYGDMLRALTRRQGTLSFMEDEDY